MNIFFHNFYKKTNKKEYKFQILKHNIYHTNVIIIQDNILIAKILVENVRKKSWILTHLMQKLSRYVM